MAHDAMERRLVPTRFKRRRLFLRMRASRRSSAHPAQAQRKAGAHSTQRARKAGGRASGESARRGRRTAGATRHRASRRASRQSRRCRGPAVAAKRRGRSPSRRLVARSRVLWENEKPPHMRRRSRPVGAAGAQVPYKDKVTGSNPVPATKDISRPSGVFAGWPALSRKPRFANVETPGHSGAGRRSSKAAAKTRPVSAAALTADGARRLPSWVRSRASRARPRRRWPTDTGWPRCRRASSGGGTSRTAPA